MDLLQVKGDAIKVLLMIQGHFAFCKSPIPSTSTCKENNR
jgi:hypothetical protein